MTRQFKTIADAVPHTSEAMLLDVTRHGGQFFTAAETAQLMREYGKVVRYATKAHWLIKLYFEDDPKRKRRYYRFFLRCLKVRGDIEARIAEWEKTA